MQKEYSNEQVLLRIATAVVDGAPVNWEREKASHDDLNPRLDRLRLIQSIGSAHSRLRNEVESPGGSVPLDGEAEPPSAWGSLQILERLGSGGFGSVYRAHDRKLDIDVALKLPAADRLTNPDRFLKEARRLARVRHPNVLVVHGADRHEGRVGLWTELLEGQTLEGCLEQQGAFGAEEATVIGLDLCRALAAVHGAGLVHRDVKTANVIREKGGRIVLLDFGAVVECDAPNGTSSGGGSMSGTPRFMAPEIFGGKQADSRSDVYSLGVVLYRLVSHRYPVEADSLAELREQHTQGKFTPLRDVRPDLPAAFVQVVERALAADPDARFDSVGEFEAALAATRGLSVPDSPPASNLLRRVGAAVVAALVGVVAFVWLSGRGPGPVALEVQASLFRKGLQSDERLSDGGRVRIGDELFLEIAGNREMNVYVVNQDASGSILLFPLPSLDVQNPLAADTLHRLPEDRREWTVTSAGDRELFLVIASVQPLPDVEQVLADMPQAGSGTPVWLPEGVVGTLRGIGGLTEKSPPTPDHPPSLSDIEGLISIRAAQEQGVWVWEMQLANPSG